MTTNVIVTSVNLCHYSHEQIPLYASFLSRIRSDITFCQEANGCLNELVSVLKTNDPCFKDASYDPKTHILLRYGYFVPLKSTIEWPQSSFYSQAYIPNLGLCALVNIHLCESQWTSSSPNDHHTFRVEPIRRIWNSIRHLQIPIVIGGDFNSFSHLDEFKYLSSSLSLSSSSNNIHKGHKRIFSMLPKNLDAFTSFFLQQQGMTDCFIKNNEDTWPVNKNEINWSDELQNEIEPHEPSGRISRIYISEKFLKCEKYNVCNSRNTCTEKWFSDHKAITVSILLKQNSIDNYKNNQQQQEEEELIQTRPILEISVFGTYENPRWKMKADGLPGEKNYYIELNIKNNNNNNNKTLGYFYVDGLVSTKTIELETCKTIHTVQIGTFEPSRPIEKGSLIAATLYNDSQQAVISVDVSVSIGLLV